MATFNIGDRVVAIRDYISSNVNIASGLTGTVCFVDRLSAGVCWDKYVDGHDCRGMCETGYGWYVTLSEIELIQESSFALDAASIDKLLDIR